MVHGHMCAGSHIRADAWRSGEDVIVLLHVCLVLRQGLLWNLELGWWLDSPSDHTVSHLLPHSTRVTGTCEATSGFLCGSWGFKCRTQQVLLLIEPSLQLLAGLSYRFPANFQGGRSGALPPGSAEGQAVVQSPEGQSSVQLRTADCWP